MNRESINKVNWVTLTMTDAPESQFYTAYNLSPIQVSASNVFADIANPSVGVFETVVMNSLFGRAPAFDMSRKLAYNGITPTALELQTRLKLGAQGKPDPQKDLYEPIKSLVNYAFPRRGPSLSKAVGSMVKEGHKAMETNSIGGLLEGALGAILSKLQQWVDSATNGRVSEIMNDTYFMQIPPQFVKDATIMAYFGPTAGTASIKMGPFIIKSIGLQMGPLIITGGLPEYINVNIGLESARSTTVRTFTQLFSKWEPSSGKETEQQQIAQ